jgi:hypothetical protein
MGGGKEMKKFVVVGLIGLMVMALSATVCAQPKLDFKASGFMDAVSFWYRNVTSGATGDAITSRWPGGGFPVPTGSPAGTGFRPNDPFVDPRDSGAWDRTNSYMEYRGILKFDATMGKELSGTVIFEMDSSRWGDPAGDRNRLGFWTADRAGVEVKNLYMDFALPYIGIPVPITTRVGIQPLGVRPHIFLYVDGAGITGSIKIDPVTIGLQWAKAVEGRDATADDVDVYGMSINAKLGKITPGIYVFNLNMNQYPLQTSGAQYGTTSNNDANFWWLGAYLDGRLGPVDLKFDFVYDYGKVERRGNVPLALGVPNKVKYRGWVTQLKVDFPWEKFNFGGLGMYASGADLRKTSRRGLPGEAVADGPGFSNKVGSYVVPPGSDEYSTWGESMFLGSNFITSTAASLGMFPSTQTYSDYVTRGTIGGTWVGKLYASMKATSWYKVTLQGLYIGDTTKHGNTLGDAVKLSGRLRDDKTIGWELDLINEIQIYNNLKWSIGTGLLFAGDALDQRVAATNRNESPKTPWIVATKLRYEF